tara:strand:- start:1025 stop:1246 length:222 start_codon:yes stop_codon:yes gene_type:complete
MNKPTGTRLGRLIKRVSDSGITEKRCPCCDEWKPHDDAHYQFLKTRGYRRSECRKCVAAKQVAYQRAKRQAAA